MGLRDRTGREHGNALPRRPRSVTGARRPGRASGVFLALVGILVGGAARARSATPPADLQRMVDQAVALIEEGKQARADGLVTRYREAARLLGVVLERDPALDRVRILRAKVHLRIRDWGRAVADAQAVLDRDPGNDQATEIIREVEEAIAQPGGRPAGESVSTADLVDPPDPADLVLIVPGTGAGPLSTLLSRSLPTVFYFTADSELDPGLDPYWTDSGDREAYALRVIELRTPKSYLDFGLPVAIDAGVTSAPFVVVYSAEGHEVDRGAPSAVAAVLERFRKEALERRRKATAALKSLDLSADAPDMAGLAGGAPYLVLALTSPACRSCPDSMLALQAIPERVAGARVLVGDVGTAGEDEINWSAPILLEYGILSLPYYFIIDGKGRLVTRGLWDVVEAWQPK